MNGQPAKPAREDLVRRATTLLPFVRENAERARCRPDENVVAVRECGLLRLWQPRWFGDLEAEQRTLERLEKTPKKVAYTMVHDTRQMATMQLALAKASVLIDTAYLHARDDADSLDAVSRTGKEMDAADRSRNRMKVGHAKRCAREAVDLLLDVQGQHPIDYRRTTLGLPNPTTPLV
jgi:hypothetical protein